MREEKTMNVIYSREPFPKQTTGSIFLAGPTPRKENAVPSWRPHALELLQELGFSGDVFVPEDREGDCGISPETYAPQIEWETAGLNRTDTIVFWVPRNLATLPAFTTNIEWGAWGNSGKVVFGAPADAPKNGYLIHQADAFKTPRFETLEKTLRTAVAIIGNGAERAGGECEIPLYIWKTDSFQSWYKNLIGCGNRIDGAKIL
ncbi:MAG: nucleoside 2-deoxyribosyltransferase domain-containing protein, partial [Candidatus Sungbacteria bacterium]|nr:nucleoside 2-deoxyribosyltransferase domain-containing protein [Candidatus Sungbacteria bacterium]